MKIVLALHEVGYSAQASRGELVNLYKSLQAKYTNWIQSGPSTGVKILPHQSPFIHKKRKTNGKVRAAKPKATCPAPLSNLQCGVSLRQTCLEALLDVPRANNPSLLPASGQMRLKPVSQKQACSPYIRWSPRLQSQREKDLTFADIMSSQQYEGDSLPFTPKSSPYTKSSSNPASGSLPGKKPANSSFYDGSTNKNSPAPIIYTSSSTLWPTPSIHSLPNPSLAYVAESTIDAVSAENEHFSNHNSPAPPL